MKINTTPPYDGIAGNFGFSIVKSQILNGLERRGVDIIYDDSEVCDTMFHVNAPGQFTRYRKDQKLIVYSMFECSQLPAYQIQSLYGTDVIITPSQHNVTMMRDSGIVDHPIYVVPMGIDPEVFYPEEKDPDKDPFFYMINGALSARKGHFRVIEAFEDLKLPNAKLIIKTTKNPKAHSMNLTKISNPDIYLVNGKISAKRLARLYRKTGLFCFPSSGEGDIGLPSLEAMACGTPVALTDWLTRESDYPPYYLPIEAEIREADFFTSFWGWTGDFAYPSLDSLKEQMVYAYEHRAEVFELGMKMFEFVRQNRTWEQTAQGVYDVLCREV